MKKNLLLIASALLLLTGCGGGYSYTNPEEPQGDYRPLPPSGIKLDGLAKEDIYDDADVLYIAHSGGRDHSAEVKFAFPEGGLLVYAYVYESRIFENDNVPIFQQDSFELYINPGVYEDQLRSNCLQVRLSPLGRTEAWIGLPSVVDDYPWTRSYAPFNYGTHIDGKLITTEAEQYDESFHNSEGVGYEFYIPYSALGLDYNPQGLDVLPAMVTADSVFEEDHTWSSYNQVEIWDLANYPSVGNRVFKDQGDNIINTDLSSSGFELSHQLDETNAYVANYGPNDQYAYFNTCGKYYYISTTVIPQKNLLNDQYPKIGIGSKTDLSTTLFLLDPRPNKDNFEVLLVERPSNGGDWGWGEAPISWAGEKSYDSGVQLELARFGNNIFYYLNGELVFQRDAALFNYDDSYPVLATMNHGARFEDLVLSTDETFIQERIAGVADTYLDYTITTAGFSGENGTYEQTGIGDQYAFFNKTSTKYTLSVDIELGTNLNGDEYPKIGIGARNEHGTTLFLLDPRPLKDNFQAVLVEGNGVGTNWEWPGLVDWKGDQSYENINMKMVRDETVITYYLNNELIFIGDASNFNNAASTPVLMTMCHSGTFKNVSFTAGE